MLPLCSFVLLVFCFVLFFYAAAAFMLLLSAVILLSLSELIGHALDCDVLGHAILL